MNNIEYRDLRKVDYDDVVDLVNKTWKFEDYFSKKVAYNISYYYFLIELKHQNYNKVVLVNNKVIGFMGAIDFGKKAENSKITLLLFKYLLLILLSKEGRSSINGFKIVENVESDLIGKNEHTYDGKVTLFLLDDDYQGMGIGSKLYEDLLLFFKDNSVKSFFLFTDTLSNYTFYDYKKCTLVKKITLEKYMNVDCENTFFLYEKNLYK